MRLDALIATARSLGSHELRGDPGVEITSVVIDSREAVPDSLFACIPGARADGHRHARAAVEAGAAALVVERVVNDVDPAVPQLVVPSVRAALGPLCAALHGHPSDALAVVGVTGTNGKTTTAHMLGALLAHAGRRVEVHGTLTGAYTTPEAPELQQRLATARDGGVEVVVMEVSSHGLDQRRVDGTRFAVSIFTNLGRDHLDYHDSMEQYFAAKARLFEPELSERAVICADDPHGRLLLDTVTIAAVAYSMADAAGLTSRENGTSFRWRGQRVELGLLGRFNVVNALGAATAASLLGLDDATIASGLAHLAPVPGRFEVVSPADPRVVVDYAHTPDGLAEVLAAARETTSGRLTVVFGCGGDRDRTKRPAMGEVAARLADRVVLTSDNPRGEDPGVIIEAVRAGIASDTVSKVHVEPDRRRAITMALDDAGSGDTVVIAGKGHETTQTIGTRVVPFDDRVVARAALEAMA